MTASLEISLGLVPITAWSEVTPSDANAIIPSPRSLLVTGGGTLALEDIDGRLITLTVSAGEIVNLMPAKVLSTGTTATGIYAAGRGGQQFSFDFSLDFSNELNSGYVVLITGGYV